VLNHEIGHGIGHSAHQPCPEDGTLAPVMMQQTLSLANKDLIELDAGAEYMGDDKDAGNAVCRANAWPHPEGD
jgi:methionine aminopeptidase